MRRRWIAGAAAVLCLAGAFGIWRLSRAWAFDAAVKEARAAHAEGRWGPALDALKRALSIYDDPSLHGLRDSCRNGLAIEADETRRREAAVAAKRAVVGRASELEAMALAAPSAASPTAGAIAERLRALEGEAFENPDIARAVGAAWFALGDARRAQQSLRRAPAEDAVVRRVLARIAFEAAAAAMLAGRPGWRALAREAAPALRSAGEEHAAAWCEDDDARAASSGDAPLVALTQGPAERIDTLSKHLAARPHDGWARFVLAWTRLATGDARGAAADFDGVLRERPASRDARLGRALARHALGSLDKAMEDLDALVAQDGTDATARFHRGRARAARADHAAARTDFDAALALAPEHAPAWHERGLANAALGDPAAAAADHTRALDFDPRLTAAWRARSRARVDMRDLDGALADLDQEARLTPQSPDPLLARARLRAKRDERDLASADLQAALALASPEWPARAEARRLLEELRRR